MLLKLLQAYTTTLFLRRDLSEKQMSDVLRSVQRECCAPNHTSTSSFVSRRNFPMSYRDSYTFFMSYELTLAELYLHKWNAFLSMHPEFFFYSYLKIWRFQKIIIFKVFLSVFYFPVTLGQETKTQANLTNSTKDM